MTLHMLVNRTEIQAFLEKHPMFSENSHATFTKAGIVPFMRDPWRFYLMRPVAKHAHLEPPKFQLCKGTRMQLVRNSWQDIRSEETITNTAETLAVTALREGMEELGLQLVHINALHDMGAYDFASAKTGAPKRVWMFAAEMAADIFSDEVEPTTEARKWLTPAEFAIAGREDHRYILRDIEMKLHRANLDNNANY